MKKRVLSLLAIMALFVYTTTAQTPELWGMTPSGGHHTYGVIFKTDANGQNQSIEMDFAETPGARPKYVKLCQASNGKLYGLTPMGDVNNRGGIFEYNPNTGHCISVMSFINSIGYYAYGSLIQASNGKLYGMTYRGGSNDKGVIFEFDPSTNIHVKKIDFDGTNGENPSGGFVQASNGKLYAQTNGGLIEYDISTNTCIKKVDEGNGTGDLIQISNDTLYGMNLHNIFQYIAGRDSLNRVLPFSATDIGSASAYGSLIKATDGKLYGMTQTGGTNSMGTIFEYNADSNIVNKKLDFNGNVNGKYPEGSLIQASNGKLYGLTTVGGTHNNGVLFEFDYVTDNYNKKLDFDGTSKGSEPHGTLLEATNGNLYGVTTLGGENSNGVIFEYNITSDTFIRKLNFNFKEFGANPYGSLLYASNGKLYGMNVYGGTNNGGVLFEHDPETGISIVKHNFVDTTGKNPYGSLIQASNGKLYGMTKSGGTINKGVLFEFDPESNIYTKKIDFNDANGSSPFGNLLEASNGKLYGMTYYGGNYSGVLFEYTPSSDTLIVKIIFADSSGINPKGSLIQATNGKLYGLTAYGGANYNGVLFEYNTVTNTYSKKIDFDGTNGANPFGSLIQASNNKLYGLTSYGGINNEGVLFEYDLVTNILTKKLDFDDVDKGKNPWSSLIQASNGNLYGVTRYGGTNNNGVLFEYDINTTTYTKTLDFNDTNGKNPSYSNLIELSTAPPTNTSVQNVVINNGQSECYDATGTITVAGSGTTVEVQAGGEATFIAGINIQFQPGFHAHSGSDCNAYITLTGDYCSSQQSMIGNPDDIYELEEINFDKESTVNIYPNPTTGHFTIDFMGKVTTSEIKLFDLQGNMLIELSPTEQLKQEMDISHLQMGMYIIAIKTADDVITRKVIKNH